VHLRGRAPPLGRLGAGGAAGLPRPDEARARAGGARAHARLPTAEAFRRLREGGQAVYYSRSLAGFAAQRCDFEALAGDVDARPFELSDNRRDPNWTREEWTQVWLHGGATTNAHYDVADNFFVQVRGTRTFRLAGPSAPLRVYPFVHEHHRQVLPGEFEPEEAVELSPGDVLFLPAFYSRGLLAPGRRLHRRLRVQQLPRVRRGGAPARRGPAGERAAGRGHGGGAPTARAGCGGGGRRHAEGAGPGGEGLPAADVRPPLLAPGRLRQRAVPAPDPAERGPAGGGGGDGARTVRGGRGAGGLERPQRRPRGVHRGRDPRAGLELRRGPGRRRSGASALGAVSAVLGRDVGVGEAAVAPDTPRSSPRCPPPAPGGRRRGKRGAGQA
ncbi:unnamed protein product, partial [Prorocentrum cordatum]